MYLIIKYVSIIIWLRGGDLNGFQDIKPFMMCRPRGWGMPGSLKMTSWSVLLKASYHKEYDYIYG